MLLVFLLCVVGIFWGAMIFDMVADLYGNAAGGVAWAVAFAVWTAVALLCYLFKAGDIIIYAPTRLYTNLTDASGGVFPQPGGVNNGDRVIAETTNTMFDRDSDAGGDTQVDVLTLNSTFGSGPTSER